MDVIDKNEKKKLWSLYENIKDKGMAIATGLNKSQDSDILIVDGL